MKAGPGLRKPGLYARAQGVEYELLSIKGRWVLMSHSPAPGFTKLKTEKNATARYVHEITADAQIDTYRLSYDGTYRGVDVQVYPQADTLMVVAKDPSSRALGFENFDRGQWMKFFPLDDPQLRFTATRTPVVAPWRRP